MQPLFYGSQGSKDAAKIQGFCGDFSVLRLLLQIQEESDKLFDGFRFSLRE